MTTPIDAPPQPLTCERCGRSTTVPALLTRVRRSFEGGSGMGRLLCPRCVSRSAVVKAGVIWGLNLACVPLLLSSWVRHVGRGRPADEGFTWFVGFALAMMAEPVLVVVHEMAHALAGRALGMRVFGMTLGTGPRLVRTHVGACTLEV